MLPCAAYRIECYDFENDDTEELEGTWPTIEEAKAAAQQHWDECRRATDDAPEALDWEDYGNQYPDWNGTDQGACEVQYSILPE